MESRVKKEILNISKGFESLQNDGVSKPPLNYIELSSGSDSDSDSYDSTNPGNESNSDTPGEGFGGRSVKRRKLRELGVIVPVGFLQPLRLLEKPEEVRQFPPPEYAVRREDSGAGLSVSPSGSNIKQFWKAGDYEGAPCGDWDSSSGGMDHVRVHPKFLHSNATSHKWALGAFAELLDNSLDEVCNGATYVNVDMILNNKDSSRMLLIEDNGGGMDPEKMRHCMSLGYSAKSKQANTIGQYGNGFKTSTMRLGADVIVFSRCCGKDGKSATQSIGLLSYTFLRSTGKEDIVVPMLDYVRGGGQWKKMIRSSPSDWTKNIETITQWSPYNNEADLLRQFHVMKDHGTRVIIYNLWEDDQGLLELDFDADLHDIQIRGVNRDEKNIQMAQNFPNSRHFLTYRHSLRSYASILYLRLPPGFRIILRGKDVEHHNIVNDMMISQEITYRPQTGPDGTIKDINMVAVVTIGFVKDAKHHIDVQGFNVYHKNRLIKPFWRLWNAAGSDGRGVIGVLEANFVEPAHDKQGFERTTVLARLEARLIQMQKTYWSSRCHKIGYAPRSKKSSVKESQDGDSSPDYLPEAHTLSQKKGLSSSEKAGKFNSRSNQKYEENGSKGITNGTKVRTLAIPSEPFSPPTEVSDMILDKQMIVKNSNLLPKNYVARDNCRVEDTGSLHETSGERVIQTTTQVLSKDCDNCLSSFNQLACEKLKEEKSKLTKRLERTEEEVLGELQQDLQKERDKCRTLEAQLQVAEREIEKLNSEQEVLIEIFAEERERRDEEEKSLRKKLQEASNTIQELLDKVKLMEKMKAFN